MKAPGSTPATTGHGTDHGTAHGFFDAVEAALRGEALQQVLALRNTAVRKDDDSYVTEGDLLVQERVKALVQAHLPGALLVSEELRNSTVAPAPGQWAVVLDPIDGTENFTSGLPEWGISLCCYRGEAHVASLIGAPEMGLWLRSGQSLVRHRSRIRGLSSSLSREEIMKATEGFEYRILGCCVVNMMNVVRGSFHSFENPKGAWCWDILAGLNLALEHGLRVTVEGEAYTGAYLPPGRRFKFKVENVGTGNGPA